MLLCPFLVLAEIGSFFVVAGKFYYDRKTKSSSHLSGGLCCCVSFWFWREIGFGCTYYYVLGVPYSCGFVLVFLVLAETVFGVGYVLSVQYSCAVVSVFLLWQESFIMTLKKKF